MVNLHSIRLRPGPCRFTNENVVFLYRRSCSGMIVMVMRSSSNSGDGEKNGRINSSNVIVVVMIL